MSQPLNFPIYLPEDEHRITENPRLVTLFWSLLALITVVRLLYAYNLPLTGDEAYFWEWARHPALGYYDHPPMAGWILWFMRFILGDTVLAIRIPAVLSGSLIVAIIYRFTLELSGSRSAASLTGILAMGLPILGVLGVLYSTDTSLLTAGTLAGYLFYRAVEKNDRPAWTGTGICFAIILASKFLGAPLIAACGLYLLIHPEARKHLRTPGPYIAFAVSLLGLVPVILWNAEHGWATFAFNFASRHTAPALGIRHLLDYLVGQTLALSPIVLIFAVPVLYQALVFRKHTPRISWKLPAFLSLVPLGGFLLLSTVTKIGLHWPGVGVPFLVVALGTSLWKTGKSTGRLFLCILSAWTITFLIFLLPLVPNILPANWQYPLRPDKINAAQLRKYTASTGEIGMIVRSALDSLPPGKDIFTFTRSYALSSLVAFYTPGHPEVTVLGEGSAHGRNHIFWFDPSLHVGNNAVFVTYKRVSREKKFLTERFHRWETLTDSEDPAGGLVSVIKCYEYNGKR
jgi:dolichol-phosphate mannosyltransferase